MTPDDIAAARGAVIVAMRACVRAHLEAAAVGRTEAPEADVAVLQKLDTYAAAIRAKQDARLTEAREGLAEIRDTARKYIFMDSMQSLADRAAAILAKLDGEAES
jgi:hypothetical protein